MSELGTALGGALVVAVGILLKSLRSGYLRDVLEQRQADRAAAQETTTEMVDRLERIDETVHRIEQQTTDLGEAMVILHEDDPGVDPVALREKVGVDGLSTDIQRDGHREETEK